jgi:biopolymer transport protein TolQ
LTAFKGVCYGHFEVVGRKTIQLLAIHLHLFLQGQLGTLLAQTGWVARFVLSLLLFFSLFSWALIFQKLRLFARLERQTTIFLRTFRTTRSLPDPKAVAGLGSPLESLYAAGYRELTSQLSASGANPQGRVKSLQAVTTDMQMAASEEVRKIERYMPWLATTGSITPFIGLFGTVWGVMDAFSGLGEAGAASLRAVAPGIAEALITTAAGLFTAIPAVMAYNHFLHHIKQFAGRMDNFTMEVAALIEKQYL